jgi:hypothetical protein
MNSQRKSVPGVDPVRNFPYFKIQVWEDRRAVWIDVQKKFHSVADLQKHARENLDPTVKARIVVIEDYGRRAVDDTLTVFEGQSNKET